MNCLTPEASPKCNWGGSNPSIWSQISEVAPVVFLALAGIMVIIIMALVIRKLAG